MCKWNSGFYTTVRLTAAVACWWTQPRLLPFSYHLSSMELYVRLESLSQEIHRFDHTCLPHIVILWVISGGSPLNVGRELCKPRSLMTPPRSFRNDPRSFQMTHEVFERPHVVFERPHEACERPHEAFERPHGVFEWTPPKFQEWPNYDVWFILHYYGHTKLCIHP